MFSNKLAAGVQKTKQNFIGQCVFDKKVLKRKVLLEEHKNQFFGSLLTQICNNPHSNTFIADSKRSVQTFVIVTASSVDVMCHAFVHTVIHASSDIFTVHPVCFVHQTHLFVASQHTLAWPFLFFLSYHL